MSEFGTMALCIGRADRCERHKYYAQPFATADDAVAEATRGRSDRWEVILVKDERIAPNAPNKVTGVSRAPHKR